MARDWEQSEFCQQPEWIHCVFISRHMLSMFCAPVTRGGEEGPGRAVFNGTVSFQGCGLPWARGCLLWADTPSPQTPSLCPHYASCLWTAQWMTLALEGVAQDLCSLISRRNSKASLSSFASQTWQSRLLQSSCFSPYPKGNIWPSPGLPFSSELRSIALRSSRQNIKNEFIGKWLIAS